MTDFKSYSQCNQDTFARAVIGDFGHFLDIGANHPQHLSNTFGLEKIGWRGFLMEIEHDLCELLRAQRNCGEIFECDATKFHWPNLCIDRGDIDYLSLDVDERTLDVLRGMPLDFLKFDVITIEHDAYRFGDTLRLPEREILTKAGYVLVAPDVANKETPDMPFEDWWVSPELADKAREILKDLWP